MELLKFIFVLVKATRGSFKRTEKPVSSVQARLGDGIGDGAGRRRGIGGGCRHAALRPLTG